MLEHRMQKTEAPRSPMYTHHGAKRNQGYLITVFGHKALGYFEKDQLVGYTFLDEIPDGFHSGIPIQDYRPCF